MSNELLEGAIGVIESCYGFDDETTPAGEAWAIVKQRITELEAGEKLMNSLNDKVLTMEDMDRICQVAIDGALGYLIQDLERWGCSVFAAHIRSRIGTNPLAELQAKHSKLEWRIVELVVALQEAQAKVRELEAFIEKQTREWLDQRAKIAELEAENAGLRADAERLNGLRKLCGYVEDATDVTVKVSQDEVTKEWLLSAGKDWYHADSFKRVIEVAIAALRQRAEQEVDGD